MAEFIDTINAGRRGKPKIRAKKLSTRIDMTPMVDLGFLLVTFFILTTSLNSPKAMPARMPEQGDPIPRRDSEILTIFPGDDHKFHYYPGSSISNIKESQLSEIRRVIEARSQEVLALQKSNGWKVNGLYVLIKPIDSSKYEDLVNLLDEMVINDIQSYAIVDPGAEELKLLGY